MPPTMLPEVTLQWLPNCLMLSLTCMASSRVGVSTSTRGPRPLTVEGVSSFCRAGSTKAAVLPVPVLGRGHQVTAFECHRNRLALDGGRFLVMTGFNREQQFFVEL